jgi:hypothetical protein
MSDPGGRFAMFNKERDMSLQNPLVRLRTRAEKLGSFRIKTSRPVLTACALAAFEGAHLARRRSRR